jgi:threonine/homoserine/homoserine lactone efflux protein
VSEFIRFIAVAAGAMLVPGPDTLLVLRTALADGAAAGSWAAAGSGAGNFVWGSASTLGATGLLAASRACFSTLKLAGAAYLVFLGLQSLRAAARGECFAAAPQRAAPVPGAAAFRRGLMCDLLNVKVGLFWTALVPQFLTASRAVVLPALMVSAMGLLAFGWLTAYALLAARLAGTLARPGFARALNVGAGVAFVALGARLGTATAW